MTASFFHRSSLTAATGILALAALCVFGTAPASAQPTETLGATSSTYWPTEAAISFTVPDGVSVINVIAAGGNGGPNKASSSVGGYGAQITAELDVVPGDVLVISVGGNGQEAGNHSHDTPGGWGGMGANGGIGNSASDTLRSGGGGGGATTVERQRAGITEMLLIAGGGGGAGGQSGDIVTIGTGGSGGVSDATTSAAPSWTGANGTNGSHDNGGKGGTAGGASTSSGERGGGGHGLGGNGGAGGGGAVGGAAGTGASGTSSGGGGGAGTSAAPGAKYAYIGTNTVQSTGFVTLQWTPAVALEEEDAEGPGGPILPEGSLPPDGGGASVGPSVLAATGATAGPTWAALTIALVGAGAGAGLLGLQRRRGRSAAAPQTSSRVGLSRGAPQKS